jgi:hypothetical protein
MNTLTPSYYTLRFGSYAEAKAICQSLGYWRPAANGIAEGPITDGMIDGSNGLRGFSIVEIGAVTGKSGYFVNVAGRLPDAVATYQVPYGSAGVVFAGTRPK